MTTWIGFLTYGDDQPSDAMVEGLRHDVVLAGKGKTLRAVEVVDGADTADLEKGAVVLRCALNRLLEDTPNTPDTMWSGLIYPLKAGSEDTVADIFANSGRPDHDVKDDDGNVVGKLIRTLVFVGPEIAIRVIEVEGDLRTVSRHMSRQPQVKAFEQEIEKHLAEPRDMVTPEGAMAFFAKAGMQALRVTVHE
jgi:SchA/CurD like domain